MPFVSREAAKGNKGAAPLTQSCLHKDASDSETKGFALIFLFFFAASREINCTTTDEQTALTFGHHRVVHRRDLFHNRVADALRCR